MILDPRLGRNRTAILGLAFLLSAVGLGAAWTLPIAVFPEVAFHRVNLIARAGDLPVEQTVVALTQPLENALSGVLGLETIRSTTTRGGTQIELVFDWQQDPLRSLQLAQAAVEEARGGLPSGTEVEARMLDTSAFPIVGIAITARQASLADLSDFALYDVAPRLRTVPGVYRVEVNGAKVREYSLTVDPSKLVRHRLDLDAVVRAVTQANIVAAAGRVRDGYQLTLSVVRGEGADPGALLDVVVVEEQGTPVRLGDIATVEASLREDFTRAAADGRTAVLLGVSRQPTGSTIEIASGVRRQIDDLARANPQFDFSISYDQADLVRAAAASVRDSIVVGLLLAVGVIYLFLRDGRSTLVAAVVIPVTILLTCIALDAFGQTFNLMTLGGIAAAIGLVLDDAIVVVENVYRHRGLGEPMGAALSASLVEIAPALVGSTLTPVAVLLPLAFLGGVPGAFFRPLALTMSIALVLSLLLALTFTPALAAALESASMRAIRCGPGDRRTARLARIYARGLGWTLRHRVLSLGAGVAFAAVAALAYLHLDTGFVPEMDEGAFVLDYWSPPGTSLQETQRMLAGVDAILQQTREVEAFSRRTGSELGFFLTETNRGDYSIRLRAERSRAIDEIMDVIRGEILERVPGLRVEFVMIMQDMIGDLTGNPSPVEVKLFGRDQEVLARTARAADTLLASVAGIVDRFDGITEVGPTYQVLVDEQRAHLAGLNAEAVQRWLETAVTGTVAGHVIEGDRAIALRVRYSEAVRERLDLLPDVTLVGANGAPVALPSLARLEPGPATVQRARENLRQLVRVTARLSGRDLGSVMRDVRGVLREKLELPAGVTLEYGGLYATQQKAFRELLLVFAASIGCVLALLLVEFGSVAAAVSVVAGSALALSGSLGALWLTGTALNVSSVVGMIMVVGIIAKNGILLLDFARREEVRTGDRSAALVAAGAVRLRPILMTSLAAVAGLAPLAFGRGAGGQMQQPLAIAIVGGVSLSIVFSSLAVPLLYDLLAGRSTVDGGP